MLKLDDIRRTEDPPITPTQRRVLDFLLKRPEEAVFLTASRLANQLDLSDASIVRLAQTLGYEGYPDLRRRLRELVKARMTTVGRLDETARRVETVQDVFRNVLARDARNLRMTLDNTDMASFTAVVRALDDARKIYVIGLRSTNCLAAFLTSALRFMKKEVAQLVPGTGEMWEELRELGPEDVVVGFSFPRYTKLTVEVIIHAREKGARVVAVTDSDLSPLAAPADWTLTVPYEIDSYMESFTAALSLMNAVVTALAFTNHERTMEALREIEESWAERGIYWEG
ncbi:MAG: MurR/RpiR family transcriptional regulator [bacterium]|nr:MAG: MurR/RpiR family transcriptional regulator [bacterium]